MSEYSTGRVFVSQFSVTKCFGWNCFWPQAFGACLHLDYMNLCII